MCIAIVKKKDGIISDSALKTCFEHNFDGAGIAYVFNRKIVIEKGFFKVNEFIKAVRNAEKICEGAMLIHCRIGTSGLKDKDNCHPFEINENLVMIHNGILNISVPSNSLISDTQIYINEILKALPTDFINNPALNYLIQSDIGTNNKFCFLDNSGNYLILNENQGHWKDNVWYSNNSYQDYTYSNWYNYTPQRLSKRTRKKIKDQINNLTDNQLAELGSYPAIDMTRYKLINEGTMDVFDEYLMDVDEGLYEQYTELFEMRGIDLLYETYLTR